MKTMTSFQINCHEYPADVFTSNQKLTIIDHDSYMRLIDMLTPDQKAVLLAMAQGDEFIAIGGRFA